MDSKTKSLKDVLGSMQTTLQCSICLDLLRNPVSTKCDHHYCRFCITEFLKTQASVPCPLCKCSVTKRSLKDRPQLSSIVDNVRLLLEAFSKDTENKNSPSCGPSASSNPPPCSPKESKKSESRGTKRKQPGSDTKVIATKSTGRRRNVRQGKRKTAEIIEIEDSSEETDIGKNITQCERDGQETTNPANNLLHLGTSLKGVEESDCVELSQEVREANLGLTEHPETVTRGRGRGNLKFSEKTKRFSDQNIFSNLLGELESETLNPGDEKDVIENLQDAETCEEDGDQGQSEVHSSPCHLTKMIEDNDIQLINKKDAKSVSKVKAWLCSNPVGVKERGHGEVTGNGSECVGSLTESSAGEKEEVTEDCGKWSCDSSKPVTVQTFKNLQNKRKDDDTDSDVHHVPIEPGNSLQDIPEIHERGRESNVTNSKCDSGGHKFFKATRNNHHAETYVRQEKGKYIFQKTSEKSGNKVSSITKTVSSKKPCKGGKLAKTKNKRGCKLREIDMNIMGSDSDPYEFKSSGTSPVQPKAKRIKLMEDKGEEGQINVTVQCMLKKKSGKSILKQVAGNGIGKGERAKEGGGGKTKKLSPKVLQRQKEEEQALMEMRDKISQAEDYDLLTSTQEVLDHMNKEGMGKNGSRKFVSFNQDVVFFGSQNQSTVKCLKEGKESDAIITVCDSTEEKNLNVPVTIAEKDEGVKMKKTTYLTKLGEMSCEKESSVTQKIERTQDKSEENELIDDITTLESAISENEADDIETMSSSTTDLDIQPDNSEFETLNIDIQPDALIEILNSQDLIPNNSNKNGRIKVPVIEDEIIPDSEEHETFLKPKNGRISIQKTKKHTEVNSKMNAPKERIRKKMEPISHEVLSRDTYDGEGKALLYSEKNEDQLHSMEVVPAIDECTEKSDEQVGLEKIVPVLDEQIGSVKVVPETPLLAVDSELSMMDSDLSSKNRTLCKNNRLKRNYQKRTSKEGKDNASYDLTQTEVCESEVCSTKGSECSETIVPPSWNEEISKKGSHSKQSSGSSATTYLSSETQESELSCKRWRKKSLKCQPVRNSSLNEVNEILETPISERFDASGDTCIAIESESKKGTKASVKLPSDESQQSLSSLSNTQESISILAPTRKPSNWTDRKPSLSSKDQYTSDLSSGNVGGTSSRKPAQVSEEISSSCEIVSTGEFVEKESRVNRKTEKGTVNKQRGRKCFSLSPEKGQRVYVSAVEQTEEDVSESNKENAEQKPSAESIQKELKGQELPGNKEEEEETRTEHGGAGTVNEEVLLVNTPLDAMIPTQLSLRSIKKKELKQRRKQPQNSPEDVFLIDSEITDTDSCQKLMENQEGVLDLDLGETAEFCDDDNGVEKSCGRKAEIASDEKSQMEGAESTHEESSFVNTDKNERGYSENTHQEKLKSKGEAIDLQTESTEERSSLDLGSRKEPVGPSGGECIRTGRRPVRGLAKKLKQKNKLNVGPTNDQKSREELEHCGENRIGIVTMSEGSYCKTDRITHGEASIANDRNQGKIKDDFSEKTEEAGFKNVVPETIEDDGEEVEKMECEVLAIPETVEEMEDLGDQLDDEIPVIPKTVDDNFVDNEKRNYENKDDFSDENKAEEETVKENVTCIEESFVQDLSTDSSHSQIRVPETSSKKEKNKPRSEEHEAKANENREVKEIVEENIEQSQTVREDSYMATGADDEPLFHSPESSPLPDILEVDYDLELQNPSTKQRNVQMTRDILDEKKDERNDENGSDTSSDFVLLSDDEEIIAEPPDQRKTKSCHRAGKDDNDSDTGSTFDLLSEDAEIALSHQDDDEEEEEDLVIRKRRSQRNVIVSDDEDVIEKKKTRKPVIESDEEVVESKKAKKPVIVSDDEEENDGIAKDPLFADDEDLDLSQESVSSFHTNLSSSAISSQSEGLNTQNQAILRQELARMKKEMEEIESRIRKGNKSCEMKMTSQKPASPKSSPEVEEVVEEPYSQYLKELQQEASDSDSLDPSQKSPSKMAEKVEACRSDDNSELDLSPLTPSPPPNDLCNGIDTELPEQFLETSNLIKHFQTSDDDKGCTGNKEEEMETDCVDQSLETIDPCVIPESPGRVKDIVTSQSQRKDNSSIIRDPMVVQESPHSQRSAKTSTERLKDLYHSTPVSSGRKSQRSRKNTLSFLSPVVAIPKSSPAGTPKMKAMSSGVELSPSTQKSQKPYSFIASGLPLNQLNELRQLLKNNNLPLLSKFSSSTTHLIMRTEPLGSRMCDRTLKFFQAVANSCWILDFAWVVDSLAAGRLLKEDSYEIIGDTVTNEKHHGPRKSRLRTPKDPGLLNGMQFLVIGSSQGLVPDDLKALIVTCGGSVVAQPEQFEQGFHRFIITCVDFEDSEETVPNEDILKFNRLYNRYKAVTVTRDWLLNSLTYYALQPLEEYVLTTDKALVLPSF